MARIRTSDDLAFRRSRILDEAIGLIGERGYYGFTVNELAKRCGLSNPGLLHYFPSKPAVLLAVLEELEAREAEVMLPLVQMVEHELRGDGAKAGVFAILRTIVVRGGARPEQIRLLGALQAESLNPAHPAHDWWANRETVLLGFFARLLGPHVAEPDRVARQLLAMLDGLGAQWLRATPPFDMVAEWESALARLLPELRSADLA